MVLLAGGTPVAVAAGMETQFKLQPEQLEAAITPKNAPAPRLVINQPVIPTTFQIWQTSDVDRCLACDVERPNILCDPTVHLNHNLAAASNRADIHMREYTIATYRYLSSQIKKP